MVKIYLYKNDYFISRVIAEKCGGMVSCLDYKNGNCDVNSIRFIQGVFGG